MKDPAEKFVVWSITVEQERKVRGMKTFGDGRESEKKLLQFSEVW